jgi:hypothetical protein
MSKVYNHQEAEMKIRRPLAIAFVSAALLGGLASAPRAASLPPGLSEEAVKGAKTPEEHQAIADAYANEAENLRAQALAHRHMDSYYSEPGYRSNKLGFPRHCRALQQSLEAAAKDADALAKAHREMAQAEAKKTK